MQNTPKIYSVMTLMDNVSRKLLISIWLLNYYLEEIVVSKDGKCLVNEYCFKHTEEENKSMLINK